MSDLVSPAGHTAAETVHDTVNGSEHAAGDGQKAANNVRIDTTDENINTSNTRRTPTASKSVVSPLSASLSPQFKLELPLSINIKNLFQPQKPKIDKNKKPKNIDKLDALAKPLHTNKKFIVQLAEEQQASKQAAKPTELPEPKNMEWIKRMSEPLVKVEKFNPEEEERRAREAAKSTNVVCTDQ